MEIKIAMDPAQAFEANLLARLKPINEITARGTSAVQEFYSGATVFLTGGSGFLGMQLIEKLLRATKLSKIFVLLRCKKGKSIEQRMLEMLQDPLYDLVREQQPDFAEKLVPVSGDVAELRLGLSEEDWKTITEQTDIIFHVAATTRFDESLRVATLINIRGTREALTLGKACKKLRSYIHVSTAFSQACVDRINTEVSETFYKSPVSPKAMIQLAESVNEGRLNDMTPSLIKNWPNTYTFTKSIAEDLINTMGDDLPVCVVKPAAVVCCKLEPVPGWLHESCLYGASGIFLAVYLGVLHSLSLNYKLFIDMIPLDYVNNAIIAAGWETAKKRGTGENKTKIYTLSTSFRNPISWAEFKTIVERNVQKYPTPMTIGYLCTWNARNPILFWIHFWLLQVIPAYIMDGISIILGNKRRFVKLATKMSKLSSAVTYFFCNQWHLNDKNTALLFDSLSDEDRVIFNFDVDDIDWREYVITWAIGLRKYIVKDGLKDTIYARKKQMVLKFLTFIILPLYFYCLYKMLYFVLSRFLLFW